ncbi:MAG TPA: hypothetical protein P5077_04870 [bacterium]|nr:hypothetical protein [bacterium]
MKRLLFLLLALFGLAAYANPISDPDNWVDESYDANDVDTQVTDLLNADSDKTGGDEGGCALTLL